MNKTIYNIDRFSSANSARIESGPGNINNIVMTCLNSISRQGGQIAKTNLMASQFDKRFSPSLSVKTSFRRVYGHVLIWVLGVGGGMAFANGPPLNPAQLGTFCPPGSELVDAKHTNPVSARDQEKIKKTVHGFIALDATARRSVGHPLGPQDYWEKGYTAMFDVEKDVPEDAVRYIAYRIANICAKKDGAFATILLDVADISGRKIEKIFQTPTSYLSPQRYWDAISKAALVLPDDWSSPAQPLIFTVLPLIQNGSGDWWIGQSEVPKLRKFIKAEWQEHIAQINKFHKCNEPKMKHSGYCELNEKDMQMLIKYSRPAWSIYPKDMKPGLLSHQSAKP